MEFSDDEGEAVTQIVSDYEFEDEEGEPINYPKKRKKGDPISFSELPVHWNDGESTDGKKKEIFMNGKIDNGLRQIYVPVTAWKFDLSDAEPQILVLSKNNWMKLQKPRKSFEDQIIRTILITIHFLHFVRKNPRTSVRSLWDHLSKVYRHEPKPSQNDLVDHMDLIGEAVKRDKILAKSEFMVSFLDEKPKKMKVFDESAETTAKSGDMIDEDDEDGSDDEEQGAGVCEICDNGGNLICCEGECMRWFHETAEEGCESLGFSKKNLKGIHNFQCKNCQYKRHLCFACGKMGSSDKHPAAEVFRCMSGECGRFYHPSCVSKLLHRDSEVKAEELKEKIANGGSFTCPFHKCCVCNQEEIEKDDALRFAMCRRCPKSYHRKCLPREISLENLEDEGFVKRAWEDLLPKNRILIYCLEHEIDDDLQTPIRNHVKFPGLKKKKQASELPSSGEKTALKKKAPVSLSRKKTFVKPPIPKGDMLSSATKQGDKRIDNGPNSSQKRKIVKAALDENRTSHTSAKCVATETNNLLPLDANSERGIKALMEDASSLITQEEINKKHKVPSTYGSSSKNAIEKTITLEKVEGSVEAMRAALQKLNEGGCVEDAKAVCGPGLLSKMVKWKNKLRVYLAPVLHGMRYSSYGRHFTKPDKLKKITELLHWYVQDGDMVVDFCCGGNEFSCFMKAKLDEGGKKCSYKNYDIFYPKNDFNFEERDWITVQPNELPPGSQLIMGLSPPFGLNASRANQFINKALEFEPKLIILIVPSETERLDRKDSPYDLVFEDKDLLAGKSFYLQGSVDVCDKEMEQWNKTPPPLYFWSRQDWTAKHKAIAQQHGHPQTGQGVSLAVDSHCEKHTADIPMEKDKSKLTGDISKLLDNHPPLGNEKADQPPKKAAAILKESQKEGLPRADGSSCGLEIHGNGNDDRLDEFPRRSGDGHNSSGGKGKRIRELDEISTEDKQKNKIPLPCRSQQALQNEEARVKEASSKECHREGLPPCANGGSSGGSESHGNESLNKGGKRKRGLDDDISLEDKQKSKSPLCWGSQPVETLPSCTGIGNGRSSVPHPFVARYQDDMGRKYGFSDVGPHQNTGVGSGRLSVAPCQFGPTYEDDMERKYGSNNREEGRYQSLSYRNRNNSQEQFSGYHQSEIVHNHGCRNDIPMSQRSSSYTLGSAPVGNLGLVGNMSCSDNRMGTTSSSVMQRYLPWLDKLNQSRINNVLGPESQMPQRFVNNRNSSYASHPHPPAIAPRPRVYGTLGFARGPFRPYPGNNSAGWIVE